MDVQRLITEQRTQQSNHFFIEDELEAAQILLQINHLIIKPKPIPILRWGLKRKRSVLNETQPPCLPLSPPLPLISEKTQIPIEGTSPSSPLSLSKSDTDSKSKHSSRTSALKKKTHKQLKDLEDKLCSQQEQLKHEVSKVREYYEKVKSENSMLKATLELGLFQSRHLPDLNPKQRLEKPTQEPSPVFEEKHNPLTIHPINCSNPKQSSDLSQELELTLELSPVIEEQHNALTIHQPPRPTIINQAENSEPLLQSRVGLRLENCFSPNGIPDLNFSADFQVAMAARARRKRRIEINRVKNCLALRGPRLR
ncbi:uncharacterized protein LOC143864276 [Tasmannia lanceolata]|uniref:uncharacterized protein LOC143864276 n=1 Tax=Tasmannia lanceolata TaxID=3420 RepID=UPI00406402F6